jgi:hypothetical protein
LVNDKPLSWWLTQAVKRVEEDAVDRSKAGLLHVYHTWKNMALIQEQQVKELTEEVNRMSDVIKFRRHY